MREKKNIEEALLQKGLIAEFYEVPPQEEKQPKAPASDKAEPAEEVEPKAPGIFTGTTYERLIEISDEDMRKVYLPKPQQHFGIISRSLTEGLFGTSIVSTEEIEKHKRKLAMLNSKELAEDVLVTIDNVTGKRYNKLTVLDKKVIIALQVCLSDQTEGGNGILQACRPAEVKRTEREIKREEKARKAGKEIEGSTELVAPNFTGYNLATLPQGFQDALTAAGFYESDIVIIFERATFLRKYLGASVSGTDYERLQRTLSKLRRGMATFLRKDKNGEPTADTISIISDFFAHSCDNTIYYVVKLNPLFGRDIANNYRRTPTNNAEILNAIGDNESLFKMYDFILTELSHNKPGAIAMRGSNRLIEKPEEELLQRFYTPNTIRKGRKEALGRMYEGLNTFYTLGLLSCQVERKKNGLVSLYLNREAFGRADGYTTQEAEQ